MSAYVNMCVLRGCRWLVAFSPAHALLVLLRFNASRIPAIPEDTSIKYPTSNGQNDHVIVLRKNRMFKVRIGGLGVDEIDRSVAHRPAILCVDEPADLCSARQTV